MLRKLKSFFRKKENISGIHIYNKGDGKTYVDVNMSDETDESIDSLAKILSMFNPQSFFEVSLIIKMQLEQRNKEELYTSIIEKSSGYISFTQQDIDEQYEEYEEDPCINPSDML